jgi:hypothetical protein
MMPVRQNPGAQLKNEKTPAASQRYDRNAVIWPQMWTPARQIASNRYDASSAKNMTPIKSVTTRHGLLADLLLPGCCRDVAGSLTGH